MPDDRLNAMARSRFTRRQFLSGAGYLAGGILLAGGLDACGGCSGSPLLLTDSPSLVPVPPIDLGKAFMVEANPSKYAKSWKTLFENNGATLDFLLAPGDYRSWGPLEFDDQPGNTYGRPRTVRYYNPGVDDTLHPAKRYPPTHLNAAQVDSLTFQRPATRNWLVQGLTANMHTLESGINQGAGNIAGNITIDSCLIENFRMYGFRIRNTKDCTVQRCVIRESIQVEGFDSSGVQVGSTVAEPVTGIKILDNEIYNVGDGIQVTDYKLDPWLSFEVLIEGNDIYLERSRYIPGTNTTWDENAIDIKAGSDRPASTVIRSNRMWGIRRNAAVPPTALGELLDVHKYCRNVVVESNIMGDAPRGMKDLNWRTGVGIDVNKPRHIIFRNNQFYDIRAYADGDVGAITHPITAGITFVGNHFARSDFLADKTPPAYRVPGPKFSDNLRVEVGALQPFDSDPPLPYEEAFNSVATAPNGYETYERKRWTGREFAMGAIPRC
jgi:hypothetical protein